MVWAPAQVSSSPCMLANSLPFRPETAFAQPAALPTIALGSATLPTVQPNSSRSPGPQPGLNGIRSYVVNPSGRGPTVPSAGKRIRSTSPRLVSTGASSTPGIVPVAIPVPVQSVPCHSGAPPPRGTGPSAMSSALLSRIDGVVSQMERELSEDLVAAGDNEPVGSLPRSESTKSGKNNGGSDGKDWQEGTVDWFDKQISAIQNRQEACEMRQLHLSDLRQLVADGKYQSPQSSSRNQRGTSEGEPERVAALEANQELLKKVMEGERQELLRVRATLESQCESRLKEVHRLAQAVERSKENAWNAEESANQRASEAQREAKSMQARLREAEAISAQASEAEASQSLQFCLLEENSRAVLSDCRGLQAKVRELEMERSALMEVQAGFEGERRALHARATLLGEQRAEMEAARQALADESHLLSCKHNAALLCKDERQAEALVMEEAKSRRCESLLRVELADKDIALKAAEDARQERVLKHAAAAEQLVKLDEEFAQYRAQHGESSSASRRSILGLQEEIAEVRSAEAQAEMAADARASQMARRATAELEKVRVELREAQSLRGETQRLYHSSLAQLKELQSDHEALQTRHRCTSSERDRLHAELQELQAVEARHRRSEATLEKMQERLEVDAQNLMAERDVERLSLERAERKHNQVEADAQRLQADHQELHRITLMERQARENAERLHKQVEADAKQLREDMEQLQAGKVAEEIARKEAESKHHVVEADLQALHEDQAQLRADTEAERRAREEVERKHQIVLAEKQNWLCDQGKLQTLMQEERHALSELERKHRIVEEDRTRLLADQQEVDRAMEQERLARKTAENKHQKFVEEMERLNRDRDKMKADIAEEQQARETAERQQQMALKELQIVQVDKGKLQADLAFERTARLETERRHAELLKDVEERTRADEAARSAEAHSREASSKELQQRCNELEAKLERALADAIMQRSARLEEERKQNVTRNMTAELDQARERASTLEQELQRVGHENSRLSNELEEMRVHGEFLLGSAEDAMNKSDEVKLKIESTWRERLELAENEIALLRGTTSSRRELKEEPDSPRPSIAAISESAQRLLEQVESRGWSSMKWKDGFTMLHWAAEKGQTDVCRYLIRLNADPCAVDLRGRTPAEVANEKGQTETADILQKAGERSTHTSQPIHRGLRSTVQGSRLGAPRRGSRDEEVEDLTEAGGFLAGRRGTKPQT